MSKKKVDFERFEKCEVNEYGALNVPENLMKDTLSKFFEENKDDTYTITELTNRLRDRLKPYFGFRVEAEYERCLSDGLYSLIEEGVIEPRKDTSGDVFFGLSDNEEK